MWVAFDLLLVSCAAEVSMGGSTGVVSTGADEVDFVVVPMVVSKGDTKTVPGRVTTTVLPPITTVVDSSGPVGWARSSRILTALRGEPGENKVVVSVPRKSTVAFWHRALQPGCMVESTMRTMQSSAESAKKI